MFGHNEKILFSNWPFVIEEKSTKFKFGNEQNAFSSIIISSLSIIKLSI